MAQMIKNCWNCDAELGADFTWCPICKAQMSAAPKGWSPNVRPGAQPQGAPAASGPVPMGTKTCWKCKNEVQNTLSACPFCHAKVGQRDLVTGMAHNTTYWTPKNIIKNIIGGGCLLMILPFACPIILHDLRSGSDHTETRRSSTLTEIGMAPGMYKVGVDLPEGEYVLLGGQRSCYFSLSSDSTGDMGSMICNDLFSNRSILTVKSGQYLTVNHARIIPISQAPLVQLVDGKLAEGMYKVGLDISPGEYKVTSNGNGYLEVARTSGHTMNSVVSNSLFDGDRYIRVSTGQYLKLRHASLIPN